MEEKEQQNFDQTLVSVGMPIRNGAKTLGIAIESVINQTYKKIEIIISDNCSTDQTAEICQSYASLDPRVRYFRQDKPITGLSNFRFVFEQSHGKYFMWAAHDDLRSENYIEVLLRGFEKKQSASLVFSDVAIFSDYNKYQNIPPMHYDFESYGLGFIQKFRKCVIGCLHIYGLLNAEYLRDYPWYDIDMGADRVLLSVLLSRGEFVYSAGAMFYSWRTAYGKTRNQVASETYYRKPRPFPLIRVAWCSATAVANIKSKQERNYNKFLLFLLFYFHIYGIRNFGLKSLLYFIYTRLPSSIHLLLWKIIKKNRSIYNYELKLGKSRKSSQNNK